MSALDAELVGRARRGDVDAFDALVERHGVLVVSVARRIVGHREDAEDVAQEVFLRFFKSIERFDAGRPLEPWLVRLAVNCSRDALKARRRRGSEPLPEEESTLGALEATQPDDLRTLEIRRALAAALVTLTEREREVFLLRDVEELDAALIAEALGIAPVTVRRLSGKGRERIVTWFRAHRPDLLDGLGLAGGESER